MALQCVGTLSHFCLQLLASHRRIKRPFQSISIHFNPFQSISIHFISSISIHFNPFQSISIHFNPFQSISIHSFQSISIHFNPFQSIYNPFQSISIHPFHASENLVLKHSKSSQISCFATIWFTSWYLTRDFYLYFIILLWKSRPDVINWSSK